MCPTFYVFQVVEVEVADLKVNNKEVGKKKKKRRKKKKLKNLKKILTWEDYSISLSTF